MCAFSSCRRYATSQTKSHALLQNAAARPGNTARDFFDVFPKGLALFATFYSVLSHVTFQARAKSTLLFLRLTSCMGLLVLMPNSTLLFLISSAQAKQCATFGENDRTLRYKQFRVTRATVQYVTTQPYPQSPKSAPGAAKPLSLPNRWFEKGFCNGSRVASKIRNQRYMSLTFCTYAKTARDFLHLCQTVHDLLHLRQTVRDCSYLCQSARDFLHLCPDTT